MMTLDQQAQSLQDALKRLEFSKRKSWTSAADRRAIVAGLQAQLAEADRTLSLPATPETSHARQQLILWAEMTRGILQQPEYHS
jgi:hypothetical protein